MTRSAIRAVTPADAGQLDAIVAALPDGATLEFAPGRYRANLWLEKSISLRGAGRDVVVLDGGGERPVIHVTQPGCDVSLEEMTLMRGQGGAGVGGNLHVFAATRVQARACDFVEGSAEAGGGVFVRGGVTTLENCRLLRNTGTLAQALWVYLNAEARLTNCLIVENGGPGPAVTASWAGQIALDRCTVITTGQTAALRVVGTGADAPTITASGCILGHPPVEVLRGGVPEPRIVLRGCALSTVVPREGIVDDGDNMVGELVLDAAWRPIAGSYALGRGAVIA